MTSPLPGASNNGAPNATTANGVGQPPPPPRPTLRLGRSFRAALGGARAHAPGNERASIEHEPNAHAPFGLAERPKPAHMPANGETPSLAARDGQSTKRPTAETPANEDELGKSRLEADDDVAARAPAPDAFDDDALAELSPAARSMSSMTPHAHASPSFAVQAPAPGEGGEVAGSNAASAARAAEISEMAHALLDEAGLWGDGRAGVARLRFGQRGRSALAGATVTLQTDGGSLRLRVEGTDDADAASALAARLRSRGLSVDVES
jgi:hypothetical protein